MSNGGAKSNKLKIYKTTNKLFKHFVSVAVPAADGNPIVKGFKGIIVFGCKPMEFEVVSDIKSDASWFSGGFWFSADIKTPIGNMKIFWMGFSPYCNSVEIAYKGNRSRDEIYMTDDDYAENNPAELKCKMYQTPILVPADSVEGFWDAINKFIAKGYATINGNKIVTDIRFIRAFFINENCEIYGYNNNMENMFGELSEVTQHLSELQELAKMKRKTDIMRLKS